MLAEAVALRSLLSRLYRIFPKTITSFRIKATPVACTNMERIANKKRFPLKSMELPVTHDELSELFMLGFQGLDVLAQAFHGT